MPCKCQSFLNETEASYVRQHIREEQARLERMEERLLTYRMSCPKR
jgi:hypothetical protein